MSFGHVAEESTWDADLVGGDDGEETASQRGASQGDFYCEPGNVRGVLLDPIPHLGDRAAELDTPLKALQGEQVHSDFWISPNKVEEIGDARLRFAATDTPPVVLAEDSFDFEATTVFVPSSLSAAEAGNRLLDFLREEVAANVTKVNRRKFTMKALVSRCILNNCHLNLEDAASGSAQCAELSSAKPSPAEAAYGFLQCELKVRGYQQQALKTCALEFQRVSGDAVVYNSIYREAKKYVLQGSGGVVAPEASELADRHAADRDDEDDGTAESQVGRQPRHADRSAALQP
jgi:hypothetical protein